MSYHHAAEMADLGQQIVAAAIEAIRLNSRGSIDGYSMKSDIERVQSEFADVPQLLASYGLTDPANCQAAIDGLFSVSDNIDPRNSVTLDSRALAKGGEVSGPLPRHTGGWTDSLPIAERAQDIGSHLREWHGGARTQFDIFFVNHIDTAFPLQAALARSLALILQAHQEIRARANADVWEIGRKTLDALHAHMAWCNCSPSTITATLTVGAAAASVLTAGGALAVTMAAFSAANAIAGAGITVSDDQKKKISGGSTLDILAHMRAATTAVEQEINNQVSSLVRLTDTLADNVASVGDRIEIPSPSSAPGFKSSIRNPDNPGGFYPTSSR
ncbi:MAG: hypothetical protein ACRDOO_24150 [Actinomadura sp.]